jgi:predicted AlkP superfamily phosphohydrolase/phosphomutase
MGRFLLIGLDGFEPTLAERWMDEGRLPCLSRLRNAGHYARLASTMPPATFPAWATCVTGVNPGRHGIVDFTELRPGAYAVRFLNATHRRAPALWNILSAAGKRVGVLGVPATYPPEPVNGFMVSGFDSPVCTHVDRSFVYPPSLYHEVRGWKFADFQESAIGPGWHGDALRRLLETIREKEGIATRLLTREPWDFFMVVFGESDTVAHHFWLFHDPDSPRHQPGPKDAIRQVYERLDRAVGALVAAAGEGVTIGVVSDHGFGGAGTGVLHLNNWLVEEGYLRFAPARRPLLKTVALATVPERWRGGLFRRFSGLAARAESASRSGGIDWRNTQAWSEEMNYFPSIRVNLKGREPLGQVPSGSYDAFCDGLCRRLESWGPVARAWRRDALYSGDYVTRAADIILELALENGYSYSCLRSRGGPSFRRVGPGEYLGGKERGMNGNHRPVGVLFLSRPASCRAARLIDVAPTVLAALGVAGPPMEGVSLLGASHGPSSETGGAAEQDYTPEQERIIEERLRSLGYFE